MKSPNRRFVSSSSGSCFQRLVGSERRSDKLLALLLRRDVQEALEHCRPFLGEQALELDDPLEAWPPHLLRYQRAHSDGDDIFVVRTVEDPDHPARRALGMHAPEKIVRELERCRRLERRDGAALRVDACEDTADRPVLARGVEPLENQEDAPRSLGVEPLLQRRELFEQRAELSLGVLFPRQAERVARIAPLEISGGSGGDDERIEHPVQPNNVPPVARPFLLVQLSDFHIGADWADGDPVARLAATVESIGAQSLQPDAVLVSGDLAENAMDAEYEQVRELLAPLSGPLYVLPGNHDDRRALHRHFGVPGADGEPVQYAADLGPVRLIAVDTTRPGEDPGALDAARLGWLDDELNKAPTTPTLLAMHHPPLSTGIPVWDEIGLAEPDRQALGDVVARHPQVRRIVAGHLHRTHHRRARRPCRVGGAQHLRADATGLSPAEDRAHR